MPRVIFDKRAGPPATVLSLPVASLATVETHAIRQWIAGIAYDIWERRGRHPGDDLWNWLTAERFVLAQLAVLRNAIPAPGNGRA